jgi:hypothetical protein
MEKLTILKLLNFKRFSGSGSSGFSFREVELLVPVLRKIGNVIISIIRTKTYTTRELKLFSVLLKFGTRTCTYCSGINNVPVYERVISNVNQTKTKLQLTYSGT